LPLLGTDGRLGDGGDFRIHACTALIIDDWNGSGSSE
jgi:hypothetical protein